MNDETKALLAALQARGTVGSITTAEAAVAGVLSCGLKTCKRYFPELSADLKREAAESLTYTASDLLIEKSARDFGEFEALGVEIAVPKSTLMLLRPIVTTTKQDRDGDILETKGAKVGERTPLLWQHVATVPIGVRLATAEHTEDRLKFITALLDLNALTEDAAKLIEAGALSISHGFKALSWSRMPGPDGKAPGQGEHYGFRIHEFEIMEHSLVSVPSNTDAIITAYSRGGLRSALAKRWAKGFYEARPVRRRGATIKKMSGTGAVEVTVENIVDLEAAIAATRERDTCACEKSVVGNATVENTTPSGGSVGTSGSESMLAEVAKQEDVAQVVVAKEVVVPAEAVKSEPMPVSESDVLVWLLGATAEQRRKAAAILGSVFAAEADAARGEWFRRVIN